jgi:hypothetical protein
MAKTPLGISGKTAEREAASGAVGLAGGGNGPAVVGQPVQLANDYRSATALSSDAITVITAQSQIDSRAAQLQAKLAALGIDDVSEEGKLILSGAVEITPGLRKGVGMSATVIATSDPIDLATMPELFDYTRAGRLASMGAASTAARSTLLPATDGSRPASPAKARSAAGSGIAAATAAASGNGSSVAGGTTVGGQTLAAGSTLTGGMTFAGTTLVAGSTLTGVPRGTSVRTLVMASSDVLLADEALIVAEELQFQDGMTLLIANNVRYLTIIAQRIAVGTGTRITWEPVVPPNRDALPAGSDGTSYLRSIETGLSSFNSPDGGDGWPGGTGDTGFAGDDGPTLEIWGLDVGALPAIELEGGPGGLGQRGGDAGDGGDGAKGEHSHQNLVNCTQGPGYGGDGGDGGHGGDGGDGGPGGRGGNLILYLTDASHEATLEAGFTVNLAGGEGGDPGAGGLGGLLGYGGEAGDPSWPWCTAAPERAGSDGQGRDPTDLAGTADVFKGDTGSNGRQGDTGTLAAIVITENEFRAKWNAPQIRTVTPWEVEVGDVVTIEGANYTADASVTFGGVAADVTFVADTILQAGVPAVPSGWVEVLVAIPGGETSNPGSAKILPSLVAVSPFPAQVGQTVTITGVGFDVASRVLFRGLELDPATVSADGHTLTVLLPAPQGPFEDVGGIEPISVRNPDGVATAAFDLQLRHVLSTGFDVARNAYSFLNLKSAIAGVADLGTFEETYGEFDVATQFLLDPVLTGAFYAFYTSYFNQVRAGYSSGFSMTAVDEYWSGNPDLFADHSAMSDVERLLTVAQGHVSLSHEVLTELMAQAAQGTGRAETTLLEVEQAFRTQILLSDEERREIAPIVQLIPAGTVLTPGFMSNLGISHGLLPIRVEYAVPGETWEKRLVVYDNAGNVGGESHLDFTRTSAGLGFVVQHFDAGGALTGGDAFGRSTATGWTLSHVPLWFCWLMDVSMPLNVLWLMSPATVVIEDEQGRRFGSAGHRVWNDLPDVIPAIGAEHLYLLPLDRNLRISVHGTGTGTYSVGGVAGSLGRSVTLMDVPVTPETRDTVEVADELCQVALSSTDPDKALTLHYGVGGVQEARALTVEGLKIGRRGSATLRAADDLSTFDLAAAGSQQPVTVGLATAGPDDVQRQSFEELPIGGRESATFQVADWSALGPDSLQRNGS